MNKVKLFIENFVVYGFGSVISKIIPLLMLPIITRLIPDSMFFGISDMSNTIISFASALAIIGMYDAMYRLFFDKEDIEYKKNLCSTTLIFTLCTSILIFLVMLIFQRQISEVFFKNPRYSYLLYITAVATLSTATNSIISAPTRMQNKRKIYLITNTLAPILSYSIAIILLLNKHYVIALPLASAISGIILEVIFYFLNKDWFSFKRFDFKLLKQLLIIALPLFPNFLIYWLFDSADRLMITNILDVGQTGIYAIGAKLGHISQLIYTAFAGGWQYFAFSTMNDKNQVKSNSMIFEYMAIVSFISSMFVCTFSKAIFKVFFASEYIYGYIVAPYLFLAPLLLMLFQVAVNQFLIIKKTWPNMLILLLGAIINIGLNLVLIPKLGIEGAAIASLLGYVVSNIIALIVLKCMKLMTISKRLILSVAIFVVYFITWRMHLDSRIYNMLISNFIVIGIYVVLYMKEIKIVYIKVRSKIK